MEAKEIVAEIAIQNSLFGMCAKIIENDEELCLHFIRECYDNIIKDRKSMTMHFGSLLIARIEAFIQIY